MQKWPPVIRFCSIALLACISFIGSMRCYGNGSDNYKLEFVILDEIGGRTYGDNIEMTIIASPYEMHGDYESSSDYTFRSLLFSLQPNACKGWLLYE